ncbi:MAG: hypothetical protein IPK82_44195 [Polyangiaceae bacterium]|nr:hypothetical protein [Polyangiaceae bacterium]
MSKTKQQVEPLEQRSPSSAPRSKSQAKTPKKQSARLGPGLHLVFVDLGTHETVSVRTLDGKRLTATFHDHLDRALVDECMRSSRMMIACDTAHGPMLMGALQTRKTIEHEPDGSLVLSAKSVRITADEQVSLEAGHTSQVTLQSNGKARLTGDRMVIDMSANVRVLSALVELP